MLRWGPVVAYVALILTLSSIPNLRAPRGLRAPDKLIHFVEYGVLGFLLRRAVGLPGVRGWALASGIAVAIGGLDERVQSMVPGRDPSILDWCADGLGAALGAWLQPRLARSGDPSRGDREGAG